MTEQRITEMEQSVDELATVVIGPRRPLIAGGGRDETKGVPAQFAHVRSEVAQLRSEIATGVKVEIPWAKITTLITAIVSAAAGIVVALLEASA